MRTAGHVALEELHRAREAQGVLLVPDLFNAPINGDADGFQDREAEATRNRCYGEHQRTILEEAHTLKAGSPARAIKARRRPTRRSVS